jgi:hypothetical protein
MRRYSPYSPGCYTMPSGRSATKREYESRMKLLQARDAPPINWRLNP